MYLTVFSFAIAGSLFAIAGYYSGARYLSRATELARSVRPSGSLLGFHAAGDLSWLLAGLATVHTVAYARTAASSGTISALGWSLTILGFASATLCYALGLLLGSLFRRMIGIFFVAVVPYGLTLYANGVLSLNPSQQRVARLVAPYIDQTWGPSAVPSDGPIILLGAYCLLVAVTFAGLVALRLNTYGGAPERQARLPRVVTGAFIGAVVAGTVTATSVSASDYFENRTTGYDCADDGRICAWHRNDAENVTMWIAADELIRSALAEVPHEELRFAEFGVPVDDGWITLYPPLGKVSVGGVVSMMLPEYISRLTATQCAPERSALATAEMITAVGEALVDEGRGPTAARDDVRRLLGACE
ncbi:hypothetical protein [uncultured Cellulomonas sp.]|uniref:hypothetical protein n=1 Tax=uncultured Cellulomonas sp. TaxID=189682 RepID=UPI0026067C28|nr:hypothetical protein [uncultured Cellulomonas sp.]